MNKIKILFVNMYYYPNMIGGAEHSLKILAESMLSMGFDVSVFTLDGKNKHDTVKPELINGIKIYRGYSKAIYRRRIEKKGTITDKIINGMHSIYNPQTNRCIRNIIEMLQPDIIHTNNLVSISYNVWKIAKEKNIKIIHTIRDYWLLDPSTVINGSNPIFANIFRYYTKRITSEYSGVVTAPSQKVLDIFDSYEFFAGKRKYVVENCVQYNMSECNRIIVNKANRTNEIIKFIFAGYLVENKGILFLLDVFSSIKKENIRLAICGDGPLRDEVKRRCVEDSRIDYKGKLSSELLNQEYEDNDVLIVPSLWDEPFGRIVIEGASFGLPVIGSNRGGIPEIINNLKNGEIFDPNIKDNLKNKILKFSNRNAVKFYIKEIEGTLNYYSAERQAKRFIGIYNEQINGVDR